MKSLSILIPVFNEEESLLALFGELNVNEVQSAGKNQNQKTAQIGELNRNKFQPRSNFNEEKLNELSDSIKQNGLIQPIAVRHDKTDPGKFEIVAGERRWLAAQKAGLNEVPVVVLNIDDQITDIRNYRVSFGKIQKLLGFVPEYDIRSGVREIITAMKSDKSLQNISDPLHHIVLLRIQDNYQISHNFIQCNHAHE